MANSTTGNPIVIDTFGADVTISSGFVRVNLIIATGFTSNKTVTFIDNDGNRIMNFEVPAAESKIISPAEPFVFPNGMIFDDSASDLAAGDFVYVYKV